MKTIKELHKPIISVVVLVYNSSMYLHDALASILAQDYYNIDLVISDDCSTDSSLAMVKDWARLNSDRLHCITVVESVVNTGVSANCNRGAKKARGEWLKFLAADDMLLPNYIHDCLEFISQTDAVALHTGVNFYKETFVSENRIKEYNPILHALNIDGSTAYQQYRLLLRDNRIIPTTFMLKRGVFFSVGGCDEDIPFIDDWPLFIKLTKNGFKIHYVRKVTANYRVRKNSIYDQSAYLRSIAGYGISERRVMSKYVIGDIPTLEKLFYFYELKRMKLVMNCSPLNQFVFSRITYYVTTPIWWVYRRVIVRLFYLFSNELVSKK
ncbi:Putative teichuronic acid biosynthesis glycosyltransferase TuaG [Patescibacteria group bacterium]|nr:Putative teichuronic acid biosynthesis glycosyltransferase TuaG [Patescibacteria group bacterium]